jgi:hypothetical protein
MTRAQSVNLITRLGFACTVFATWLHRASLEYLRANASAIVVGSVTSRVEDPNQVSFTIDVARVLQGNIPGSSVNVVHPWAGLLRRSGQIVNQSIFGIWFLTTNDASGNWDLLTARPTAVRTVLGLFLPASPTPPTGPYAYPPGTPLIDSLVYETAAGVQSSNADPELLLGAFDSMDTATIRSLLASILSSRNPGTEAVGLAGSLERALPGAIQNLVDLWPAISTDTHASDVVSALASSWRDLTPAAVQQLATFAAGALAGSDIRSAAVRALAAIHTRETLPFLASLLSSADANEQVLAVYGLSAFANGCPVQTRDNVVSMAYLQCTQPSTYKTSETVANFGFRPGPPDEESALVSFWKTWWDSHPELH